MQLSEAGMREVFARLRPLLDERQDRALAGLTARTLGRAGVAQVASVFGTAICRVIEGRQDSPKRAAP